MLEKFNRGFIKHYSRIVVECTTCTRKKEAYETRNICKESFPESRTKKVANTTKITIRVSCTYSKKIHPHNKFRWRPNVKYHKCGQLDIRKRY